MTKKIAIIGFGSEGLAAYNFWAPQGADITIFDESVHPKQAAPPNAKLVSGPGCFDDLYGYDVVMRFPGIPLKRIHTDGELSSVTKEFFKHCPAPIIGITGSKGKGTTSSLIALMLQNAGITAHLLGNIGIPALNELPKIKADDVVVFELSSFQLWDMKQSPQVAVVLMIEADHLEVHDNMDDYVNAKSNIVRWQKPTDVAIYHPTNKYVQRIVATAKGIKLPYTKPPAAHVKDSYFVINEQKICSTSQIKLVGKHNIENACAAITAAWQFTQNTEAIAAAITSFTGLEHRLKYLREIDGVKYYDDSIATTPGSAIAALNSFKEPKVIILGGSDKGAEFTELAQEIKRHDVRRAIVIGAMRNKIAKALDTAGYKDYELFDETTKMARIVQAAYAAAKPGDIVIMSPACASFDMFKSYKDRGEQFITAVENL